MKLFIICNLILRQNKQVCTNERLMITINFNSKFQSDGVLGHGY